MAVLEIKGRKLELSKDGHLADPDEWDEDVARGFAELEGRELTDEHWKVIFYLREYWQQFAIAPMMRKLCKDTGYNLKKLDVLFPGGPLKNACKLAGLPKPMGCI
jgi:TusE/DsrC/DsvC family sulfur relay protein